MSTEDGNSSASAKIDSAITEGKRWKPFLTNLNDAQIKEIEERMARNDFMIDIDGTPKRFARKKIRSKEYAELENIKARIVQARGPERAILQDDAYRKSCLYYLGMTAEEYEVCDFEEVKKIIDAQNLRTQYGAPLPTQATS